MHRAQLFAQEKYAAFGNRIARISDSFQAFDSTRKRRPTMFCPAPATGGNLRSRRSRTDRMRRLRAREYRRQRRSFDRFGAGPGARASVPDPGWRGRRLPGDAFGRRRPASPAASSTHLRGTAMRETKGAGRQRFGCCSWKCVVRRPRFVASFRAMPPTVGRVIRLRHRVAVALSRASMRAPGFAPARSSNAATLSVGRAVRRSERMSATPPLSRAEPVASGSLRGVRSIPLRDALREFFGLGAPDASLISRAIRIGSTVFRG